MTKFRAVLILVGMVIAQRAHGQTLCPTVSDNVSVLQVYLTGTPKQLDWSEYDLKTSYLTVAYMDRTSQMLVGVPRQIIQGHQYVQWVSVSGYPSSIMQQGNVCPLLTQTGTPIIKQ